MAVPKLRFKDDNGEDYPDWEKKKLGDILVQSISDGPHETPILVDEGVPFISVDAIVDGKIDFSRVRGYITKEYDAQCRKKYSPQKYDVYMVKSGSTTGDIAIADTDIYFNIWSPLAAMRTDSKKHAYFLFYLLHTSYIQNQVLSKMSNGTQPNLGMKALEKFNVVIPKHEEQQKIADFLTTFDKRITAQQNIIADMEETKKGLLQKIFSQEIRFKDDNGEDYPEWEKKSWEENVIISTDMVNPKNEEYINLPHVGPGNIESFNGCLLDNILTAKEENLISGKFHFMPGAIIYGKINPQLAKYAHVNFEGLSSADAYVLTATNSLCQNFLFFLLQSKDFFRYSVMVSRRTGMPKINRDELNAFKFMCPSLQEQQKIASFLSTYDKKIEAEKKILADLQEMKKGLLQQMFV